MLSIIGEFLAVAALSIIAIPIVIVLTALMLLVLSFPLRLFKATRAPATAVGIPAVALAVWTLWYGDLGFFRVGMQYGFASMLVIAFLEVRDRAKRDREVKRPTTPSTQPSAASPKPLAAAGEAASTTMPSSDRELVRLCLAEAERAREEIESSPEGMLIPPELMEEVRKQLKDGERTVHTIRVDGVSPRNLAWLLISNISGELIACGGHHVYRGVLSMTGTALRAAYLCAIEELQKGGYQGAADAAKDREWLEAECAEAG